MGWGDDPGPAKGGSHTFEPAPIVAPILATSKRQQFGLRHLMMLSVYFAILFAGIARAINTGREVDAILAVISIGFGLVGFGLFLTLRLVRWTGVGWFLVFIGLGGMSIVMVGYFSILTIPLMIGVIVNLTSRRRIMEQESLLWVLALASERERPLGPAVSAHAMQTRGVYRLRAQRVAECLDHGMPLPDALDFVSSSAPALARVIVRVGHDSGALTEALRDAATARSSRPAGWQTFGSRLGYVCLVFAILQIVVSFIMYFIIPKFEAIFKDFGMRLPDLTLATIQVSHWMTSTYVFPILTAVELAFPLYLIFAFSGYRNLKVPFLDRFFGRRHSVLILRCLAMIVEGGKPITVGLQILAQWYPTAWVRERLAGAMIASEGGLDWIEALRAYRLISRTDAALLESARRAGNLPWALRQLAEGSTRKLNYRLQIVSQFLITFLLLAMGGVVGLLTTAYFLPLTELIRSLAR